MVEQLSACSEPDHGQKPHCTLALVMNMWPFVIIITLVHDECMLGSAGGKEGVCDLSWGSKSELQPVTTFQKRVAIQPVERVMILLLM